MLDIHCMELLSEPSSLSVAVPWNVTESPSVDSEPEDGDEIDTVGEEFAGSLIVTDTCCDAVRRPLSVTVAVMVWVPAERVVSEKKLSVAKNPSMLEVHCMELLSEPSSLSVAEAQNVTLAPSSNSVPSIGLFIVKKGGWFCVDSFTVVVMLSVSDNKPESVTWAVMVWVPTDRFVVVYVEPVPMEPSMLEVHWICELSEPSSASVAVPWNVTESPSVNSEPDDGDNIDTVGGEFAGSLIVTDTCCDAVRPPESVTWAVMV
jgi:hypothetical protein